MTMIQIRNVPPELHRKLKVRAAEAGMSLSEYLLSEIEYLAALPTPDDFLRSLEALPKVELDEAPHETLRRLRDAAG
jgi:plasmid stability protein